MIELLNRDYLQVMDGIKGNENIIIVTDPPFNSAIVTGKQIGRAHV